MVSSVVELDVLTGEVQVLSVDLLYDCGQRCNPPPLARKRKRP